MSKRGLGVMTAVLGLGWCVAAQPTNRPEKLLLNNSSPRFPSLELSDAQYFSFATAFNWLEPAATDFLPPLPTAPQPATIAHVESAKDSSKEDVDLSRKNLFDYAHGEIGFLYGRSTGKFDREVEQGYVIGTVGNDKLQITAGALFEHSSGDIRRFGHR
ncbi:MAG: hypothetical protein ABR514_05785 [Chthoniobacterales bacterium]